MSWASYRGLKGAMLFYDNSYHARWLDAIGENVVKYLVEPGQSNPDQTTQHTLTVTGTTPTVTLNTDVATALKLLTTGTEYDGINYQAKNSAFKLESDKPMYFGIKFEIDDATQVDILAGLCVVKTDLLKTAAAHGITATNVEGIFFFKVDGGTVLTFKTYKDGAEKNTADYGTALDTDAHVFEFYWDGATLYGYIDNSLVATFTANMPDTELTPSINVRSGSDAARTMKVHWERAIELR